MSVKFSEKSIVLYGCPQLAENVSVVNNSPTGTVTFTVGSATVTGTSTLFLTEVAPQSYLYSPTNEIIGQVSSVASDTSLTLVDSIPLLNTVAAERVMGVFGRKSVTFTTGSNLVTLTNHGLTTGVIVKFVNVTTTTTIADDGTPYYVIWISANTFKVATSLSNAQAGTAVSIDASGTGALNHLGSLPYTLGLGPKNALPVLNLNFSTEFTTEAFQYVGDELDRDEQTTVTDKYAKYDFEAFMPALGSITSQTITAGTGKLAANTGSHILTQRASSSITNATIASEIAVGDYIYTTSGALVGTVAKLDTAVTFTNAGDLVTLTGHTLVDDVAVMFSDLVTITDIVINTTYYVVSATTNTFQLALTPGGTPIVFTADGSGTLYTLIELTANAAVAMGTTVGFKVGKSTGTPADTDLPMSAWLQSSGFGFIKGNGYATATNSVSSNVFLTVEIRRDSPDLVAEGVQKTYITTDARGNFDLDLNVGSRAKFKYTFNGNLAGIEDKFSLYPNYGTLKDDIAPTAKSANISLSALTPYAALVQVTLPTAGLLAGETFIVSGLTYTATTTAISSQDLVNILDQADVGDTAAVIVAKAAVRGYTLPTGNTLTGTLNNFYIRKSFSRVLNFWSPGQYGNIVTLTVTGTAAASTVTVISNNQEPPTEVVSNVCFEKMTAPVLNGYTYGRYLLSCNDGWSKIAAPSDVTLSILEDRADADYNPDNNVEKNHKLVVKYGSPFNNKFTSITMHKIQLAKLSPSKVANYAGQDLNFRNIGTTDIQFS